jgi:hypothetical protein
MANFVKTTTMTLERQSLLRLAGVMSILCTLVNAVADLLLFGGGMPVSGAEITVEALRSAPYQSVFTGSILGVIVIPFWLLGLWPVYEALKPAGSWLAWPVVLFLGYALALFPLYHGAFAFYAAGYQALAAVSGDAQATLTELIERFLAVRGALYVLIAVSATLGSLWFIVAVVFGRTRYARWMAVLSPLLVPLASPLVRLLPAPIGGYALPPFATLIFTVFFLLATVATWNQATRAAKTSLQ